MKNYEIDNEILFMIEEENEDATLALIDKYSNLINICISKYNKYLEKIGLEEKDLYQEGLLGLLEAANRFDKNKKVKFVTFATTCIDSRIKSYLKASTRNKHSYLNNSLSLDNIYEDDITLYDFASADEVTPEEKILLESELKEIYQRLKQVLTDFEYVVFSLHIKGYKNEEIASKLKKEKRSIENTLYRIKTKLKEVKKDL